MTPSDDKESPVLDDEALALRQHRRRMLSMGVFLGIFCLPVLIGTYLVWRTHRAIAAEQAWASAELAKPEPAPAAYGVRGAGLLSKGQAAEAVPLLRRAADLEAAAGPAAGVKAKVMLVEALLMRAQGRADPEALAALAELERRAPGLTQGQQAAAWHAAGKLYRHAGRTEDARRCLAKAVELQPDDWVQRPDGQRYKHRGISSIYQKDLAAALRD